MTLFAAILRELGVKRMRWGQRDSLWEVVGPVEVNFELDGIDFYASALVVLDNEFTHGIVLGNDQLRCWTVTQSNQEVGVAQLDENAMLEVQFPTGQNTEVALRGLVDTGAGGSLMTIGAWKRLASSKLYPITHYDIRLTAANGQEVRTFGLVENVTFKLAGYLLQTSFILIEDVLGDDFILGRSFLRRFDVLIDIRGRRLTIRDPHQEGARQELLQVKDNTPIAKAKVLQEVGIPANTSTVLELKLDVEQDMVDRVVLLTPVSDSESFLFIGESLSRVREGNRVQCTVINRHPTAMRMLKEWQVLALAYQVEIKYSNLLVAEDRVATLNINSGEVTESELSSSSIDEFFSNDECSIDELELYKNKKDLNPELLTPVPAPDFNDVRETWGADAVKQLEELIEEYNSVFMQYKGDIGKCKIAKHRIRLLPDCVPHREGARRMTPEKAAKANQEVTTLTRFGIDSTFVFPLGLWNSNGEEARWKHSILL